MGFYQEFKHLLKQNIREYGMYIALVIIMLIFTVATDGLFMSSRNISNLINQTGYIAVLAVGMTLVIIIRHIDLSVGYASGFLGAIAAILITRMNMPVLPTIFIVLICGILVGMFNGFFVAKMNIPSFVVTLAAMLIFRGGLLLVTEGTGTIVIPNKVYNAIGNGYIPELANINGFHLSTLLVGILAIGLYIWSAFRSRKNTIKYNFETVPMKMFVLKLLFVSLIIAYIAWILAGYNGLSWTVVIVIAVVAIYQFITTKTMFGRHVYAVGGNPEAAKLSGIDVNKVTLLVFASMGLMAALSGILFSARLQSASTTAGTAFELDAIAGSFVGGASAAGGVGKVTGSIVGALVMSSLINGMNLMNVGISYQYIIKGAALVAAVIFDVKTRNKRS